MMIIVFGAIATSHPILATIRRIANFLDIPYDNDDTPQPYERLPQLKPKQNKIIFNLNKFNVYI